MKTPMQYALEYAALGWRVLPLWEPVPDGQGGLICACDEGARCGRGAKHPRTRDGVNEATANESQIRLWWTRSPNANVGIATGRESGLTVIDADAGSNKPGIVNLTKLAARHGGLPETKRAKTGAGEHLYFAYCEALRTGANVLAPAVDCRNDQGYVVAPPSMHITGARYEFISRTEQLAAVPEWMLKEERLATVPGQPTAKRSLSLDQLPDALNHIDPDDRDAWLRNGVVIGREYERSPESWAIYEAWASRSKKFDEDRAGNLKRMKEMFQEVSQEEPRAGGRPLSLGTLIRAAKKGGWKPPEAESLLQDADHYRLAEAVVEAITEETGERPVYARGALWCVEDNIWCARTLDSVGMHVARIFAGGKYCKRGGDFISIANVVAKLCEDERFFEDAAVGVAAPGGFWKVTDAGAIECEPLTPAHRQRMRVSADPELDAKPALLLQVLRNAFGENEPDEQTQLVQQLFGCAITHSLWRHRVVALFLGATNSGKSTLLTLLSSVFPQDQIGACGPQKWGNEYYIAALAGVSLNIVGDLDKKEPIPGAFKNVVGRDLIQGRHPTHRPFTFTCEAAHFFNSNHCPPTADHGDAFFNRWRVVHFTRSVPAKQRDRDMDKRLIATETGAMLGWALKGAADVMLAGHIMETTTHKNALQRWRVANNSALSFIFDPNECERTAEASTKGQDLYKEYREWAKDNGLKPFGRNGFYEALTEGAGEAEIEVIPRESSDDHQLHVKGVRLQAQPQAEIQVHRPAPTPTHGRGF